MGGKLNSRLAATPHMNYYYCSCSSREKESERHDNVESISLLCVEFVRNLFKIYKDDGCEVPRVYLPSALLSSQ